MRSTQETEQAVIATLMLDPTTVPAAMGLFVAEDFGSARYQEIFGAIAALDEKESPIDPITIWNEIQRRPGGSVVGSMAEVGKVTYGVPSMSLTSLQHAHKTLREAATKRRLAHICSVAAERFASGAEPAADIAAFVEEAMDEVRADIEMRHQPKSLAEIAPAMEEVYDEYLEGKAEVISSGFPWLDKLLSRGGFRGGQMIVIAAPTGGAKSAMGLGIAREIAKRGQGAIYFSLEMTEEELFERIHAPEAAVSTWHFRNHISTDNYRALKSTMPTLRGMQLYIDDRSKTLGEIRRHSRNLCRRHAGQIKAIVIDYVQLMKLTHESDPNRRTAELSSISTSLKQMAKDLRVPVIVLSQLNREYVKTGKPQAHNLRDCGQLEQDADTLIFIDLEDVQEIRTYRQGSFRIGKQRGGPRNTEAATIFNGAYLTFHDAEGLEGRKASRESAGLDPEELVVPYEGGTVVF